MPNPNWQQDFKKLDLPEQATFFVLGAIDTVFHTLTNTFQAIADVSYSFADFTRPGASEKLGARSLEAILGFEVKTDKIKRPEANTESESISVKPSPSKTIPIKKKENGGNGGE
jgi:hypothetical protein